MNTNQPYNKKKKNRRYTSSVAIFISLFFVTHLLYAGFPALDSLQAEKMEAGPVKTEKKQDSPKKLKSRQTWETIINIPGAIVYLPFWLAYSGIKPVLHFLETSKLISGIEDFLVSNDGKRITLPTSRSRTGLGLKFSYSDFITKDDSLDLTATLGLRWSHYFSISLQRVRLGSLWKLTTGFRNQYLSMENYFGLGNDSLLEEQSTYALRQTGGWLSIKAEPNQQLTFGATLGLEHGSVGKGRHPKYPSTISRPPRSQNDIPGIKDNIMLASLNFHLELDTLTRSPTATEGWMIFLKTGFFNQINGNKFAFTKTAVDIRRHFHLFFDRILVLRLSGTLTRPLNFEDIPFYLLSEMGHRHSIRGFKPGRFRDRDRIFGSLEYHFPLNKRPPKKISLNAYLFLDAGKVSPDLFHDSLLENHHIGFGGGLRIFNKHNMDLHLIIGSSREGIRFALVINESEKNDLKID
jgi:hypothetical protein